MEKIYIVFLHRFENKLMSGELIKVTDTGFFCIKAHDNRFYWVDDPADIRWVESYEALKKFEDIDNWKNDYKSYKL